MTKNQHHRSMIKTGVCEKATVETGVVQTTIKPEQIGGQHQAGIMGAARGFIFLILLSSSLVVVAAVHSYYFTKMKVYHEGFHSWDRLRSSTMVKLQRKGFYHKLGNSIVPETKHWEII
jgi:hypothetical protein